ncbi:MAG: RES family NAD+ phosphorylase [Bacteroidota bacterium]
MKVYRLTRRKFSHDFNGKGAAMCGARWNSKGTELIYTSDSRALAMAEVAVHLSSDTLPSDFMMLEIDIPDTVSFAPEVSVDDLHPNWNAFPHDVLTQLIGDQFIQSNAFCALKVPSAVVKGDFNILINPVHPDFGKIRIIDESDFPFDRRFVYH